MTFIPAAGRRQFAHGHPAVTFSNLADDALQGGLDCTPVGVADTGAPTDAQPMNTDALAAHRAGVESPWPPGMAAPSMPVVESVDLRQPPFSALHSAPISHAAIPSTTNAPGE